MKKNWHFGDIKYLLRQAIAAWTILLISIILYTTIALILSILIQDQNAVVVLSFVLVSPVLILMHIYMKSQNYQLVSPFIKYQSRYNHNLDTMKTLEQLTHQIAYLQLERNKILPTDNLNSKRIQQLDTLTEERKELIKVLVNDLDVNLAKRILKRRRLLDELKRGLLKITDNEKYYDEVIEEYINNAQRTIH